MEDTDDIELRMERCVLDDEEINLPSVLAENPEVFMEVMSMDTWQKVLTEPERQHLLDFLPKFPQAPVQNTNDALRALFSGQNFKFGNPLSQFYENLKDGSYTPDIVKYRELCKKAQQKHYKAGQREYYVALLKEIIVNREKILNKVKRTPIDHGLALDHVYHKERPTYNSTEIRARKRYHKILQEVCNECEEENSSEDEEITTAYQRSKPLLRSGVPEIPSESIQYSVQGTFDPIPVSPGETSEKTTRQTGPLELLEDDYLEMLRKHRKRRLEGQDDPDLDTKDLSLEDLVQRVQPSKKLLKGIGLSKKKPKLDKKKLKLRMPDPEGEIEAAGDGLEDEDGMDNIDIQGLEQNSNSLMSQPRTYGAQVCFFTLLRDFFHEHPENRFTTVKLEEQVRQWQESGYSKVNPWFNRQSNWMELVTSALKFLAGDVLDLGIDNFVPYLDYKERAQQWRWIGHDRDSDAELSNLCAHWQEYKDQAMMDKYDSNQNSPPPPRIVTTYVVKPSTDQEKAEFRVQEKERFDNPHKAFTFRLHNYESVVGPVKGVYNKDGAVNKAREHPLLVNDRHAYVTVLTLVRDSAARLPNGEGTRADICELLKDSQFLAPGVTDSQVNNVVSGALDRLHYEKDPCVKYDVNKKIWIYLHRNRTQDELEKIHQAQGAAAKAKKALHNKPKSSKLKSKEISSSNSAATSAAVANILSNVAAVTEPTKTGKSKSTHSAPATSTASAGKKSAVTQPAGPVLIGKSPQAKPTNQVAGSPSMVRTATPDTPKTSAVVFLQPQLVRPVMASQAGLAGKPLPASLIQSLTSAGLLPAKVSSVGGDPAQGVILDSTALKGLTNPVSTATAAALTAASLFQSSSQTGSPRPSPAASPKMPASPRPQVAPTSLTSPQVTPPTTPGAKGTPRVALQLSSPQQMLALGALTKAHGTGQARLPGKPTTVTQALALQRSMSLDSANIEINSTTQQSEGKPGTPQSIPSSPQMMQATSRSILQQISLSQGSKPGTVVLGSALGGKTGLPASVISTQLVQSAAAGQVAGTPVVVGGKPIVIGGKPVILASNQLAGGKVATVQLAGKPGQLGQRGVLNLVPQATDQQLISQASSATTSVSGTKAATATSTTQSIVSQILQSGTALVRAQGHTQVQGQANKQSQGKGMPQGQGSIILTQFPRGAHVAQGAQSAAQTRGASVPHSQLLQGAQIFVQSTQAQSRVVTPQMLATGQRPALLTTAGARSPGVQYLKTMTQPGVNPSHSTLVLTQAGLQTIQATGAGPESQASKGATLAAAAAAKQTRTGPVYARVITPPSNVRLAGVKPGQTAAAVGLAATQGVSIVQSAGKGDEVVEVVDDSPDTEGSNTS